MKVPIDGEIITECLALVIIGTIVITSIIVLGPEGKEIPLALGGALGGYLTKSAVSAIKKGK